MTAMTREPFDWIADRQIRHGGLRMIRTAVRRGWLAGSALAERRAKLISALMTLLNDPATEASVREELQVIGSMVKMTEADMGPSPSS